MSNNRLNLVVNFAEAGLNKLEGGLKNLVGLGKTGSRAFRDMARESRGLERELAGVRRELAGASGNVTELIDRERELERAVEGANRELSRQSALAKIDAGADAIRQRGEALRARGRDNVMGGAAMFAPLLIAGKAAADFSSGMVDIQQKAELSDSATARLRNNILAAARASKQMPEDMRAAVDTLAGLGLSPEEAVRAAQPMGRFMTAFKVQGTDAAASVYAGFQNLNIPLERSGRLLDMMAAGGNQGAFEARDMAAALPSLTAQLKALGQTGDTAAAELIAALEIVRRGTGTSGEAATAVNDLLSKLTAPTTIAAFGKKNIDVLAEIRRGATRGISPLETMIALTERATGGDKMMLGQFFTEKDSRTAIRQLMLDYSDFQKMKSEIGSAEGLTSRAFDQRVANDQTVQLRELGGAMANLALSVAPVLLPFLKQATIYLSSAANAVSGWAEKHPQAAGMLLKLFAAVAVGRIALGGLQLAFGGLLGPMATAYRYFARVDGISRFGGHLTKFKGILSTTASVGVKAFGILRSGAMLLARGLMRAGMMMLANPMIAAIALIVIAVGLLAYAIYSNWDKIKAGFNAGLVWLSGAWETFKGYFNSGVEFLASLPARFLQFGKDMISGLVSGILAAPGRVWEAIKSVVMSAVTGVGSLLKINSPSKVFMAFGSSTVEGMALGIDRNRQQAFASARQLATGVAGAAALATGTPLAAAPLGGVARSVSAPSPITINVYQQPGESTDELARRLEHILDRREREDRARRNSSFGD